MAKRARKEATGAPPPFQGPMVQQPRDCAEMAAEKTEPPRNRVADLAKAEAFYLSLADLPFHVSREVRESFKAAVAVAITEMRLRP